MKKKRSDFCYVSSDWNKKKQKQKGEVQERLYFSLTQICLTEVDFISRNENPTNLCQQSDRHEHNGILYGPGRLNSKYLIYNKGKILILFLKKPGHLSISVEADFQAL